MAFTVVSARPPGPRAGPGGSRPREDQGHFFNPAFSPTGPPPPRRISYHGTCPQGLADSAWIPFREHCYSFHMELLLGHKEALQRCQRGGLGASAPTWALQVATPPEGAQRPHECGPRAPLCLSAVQSTQTTWAGHGCNVAPPLHARLHAILYSGGQRRGRGLSRGSATPRRLACPDVGLLCVQRAARSCPSWMRWRTCLSGSICRALRARVGAPGWA